MTTGGITAALGRLMARADDDMPVRIPRVPAREAAEHELSDPRYHQHDPNPLRQALDWFWDRVDDLFTAAAGATPGGWTGLAAVAAMVLLLIVALRLRLGALRRTPATTGGALFTDAPRSAAEHRTAANRLAAERLWNQAMQERMRAIVLALEERALLTPAPGRTADEAAAAAGRVLPAHADRLSAAARTFDDVTYGGRPGTEREYALLTALDSELQHARPHLAAAPTRSRG
ncbi:DUF4129 domain-containing protein [Streptomyces chattanoogensis]|uniref:DUF4129 domain-containing protein n=1 Tax=Streptomyces chattanoogensis TaxID=66876 RepID=UPI00062CBB8D